MMVDDIPKRGNLRRCRLCNEFQHWVKDVALLDKHGRATGSVVEFGRCANCDTNPCDKCGGRTLDGTAPACKHCGASIRIRARA